MREASWERKAGGQIVTHAFDQHEFSGGDGFRGGAAAADVAHAVGQAVDHQGGHLQSPQAFGSIARG